MTLKTLPNQINQSIKVEIPLISNLLKKMLTVIGKYVGLIIDIVNSCDQFKNLLDMRTWTTCIYIIIQSKDLHSQSILYS